MTDQIHGITYLLLGNSLHLVKCKLKDAIQKNMLTPPYIM
jgi:hypothetical protein